MIKDVLDQDTCKVIGAAVIDFFVSITTAESVVKLATSIGAAVYIWIKVYIALRKMKK